MREPEPIAKALDALSGLLESLWRLVGRAVFAAAFAVFGAVVGVLIEQLVVRALGIVLDALGITPSYDSSTDQVTFVGLVGAFVGLALGWLKGANYFR